MTVIKYVPKIDPWTIDQWIQQSESAQTVTGSTTTQATATVVNSTCVAFNANAASAALNLPPARAGLTIFVRNTNATNAAQVFSSLLSTSDTINGTAGATGVAHAAATGRVYFCTADGAWQST